MFIILTLKWHTVANIIHINNLKYYHINHPKIPHKNRMTRIMPLYNLNQYNKFKLSMIKIIIMINKYFNYIKIKNKFY